ncbi:MAG: hypothetical protein HRU12_23780, partial [Phaeodactylibacter sp.]|nr:hypothetical protein [Phaeodactylibacter sp.]
MSDEAKPSIVGYTFREADIPQPTEKVVKLEVGNYVKHGEDNLYPQEMCQLYYESPIHQGIIGTKVDFITHGGIKVIGVEESEAERIHDNGDSQYTLSELIEELALDQELQEYFVLHYKRGVNGWYVDTISAELCRSSEDLRTIHRSDNWKQAKQSYGKYNYRAIPSIFDIDTNDQSIRECVMYVKSQSKQIKVGEGKRAKLSTNTYPIVKYSGSIPLIQADIEMNYFHFSEAVNGFHSGTIINMNNGKPESEAEKEEIVSDIKGESSDRKSKGGISVVFNDGQEEAVTVESLNGNNLDVRYLATQEYIRQEVLIGHSVQNAALFALETSGKLGNSNGKELESAYIRLMDTWGNKRRKKISAPIVEGLNRLNGTNIGLEWDNSIPEWIKPKSEEEPTSEATLNQMAAEPTPDEMIAMFEKIGRDRNQFTFITSREFETHTTDAEYIADFMSHKFQIELSETDQRILQMVSKGESWTAIKSAVDMDSGAFAARITTLTKEGLIRDWTLTDKGKESVATEELIEVVYTYEKRPEVSGPAILPNG